MQHTYLESIKKEFEYYKLLGERTFTQLEEKDLFWQFNDESNSIAIMVNHLSGNMKSRWTDFLTSDGEKEWRNRELEFEQVIKTKGELIMKWNEGWELLFAALGSVDKDNFETEIYIRNQGHTIIAALNRQLAHYSYHIGQIVYVGKMIKSGHWESLSIPKGKSSDFNKKMFLKEKRKEHFTNEILRKTSERPNKN